MQNKNNVFSKDDELNSCKSEPQYVTIDTRLQPQDQTLSYLSNSQAFTEPDPKRVGEIRKDIVKEALDEQSYKNFQLLPRNIRSQIGKALSLNFVEKAEYMSHMKSSSDSRNKLCYKVLCGGVITQTDVDIINKSISR